MAKDKSKTILTFIGGVNKDRIGGNCYVLEHTDAKGQTTRIMFDLGSVLTPYETGFIAAYPNLDDYFDRIDPETKQLVKARKPVSALFLTHKHDDHNGALINYAKMGYILPQIYTGNSTRNFIRLWNNMEGVTLASEPKTLKGGEIVSFGDDLQIEAFNVSHSTSDALGFHTLIKKDGKSEIAIVNNGDFKTDEDMPIGPSFNKDSYLEMLTRKAAAKTIFLMDSTSTKFDEMDNIGFEKNVENIVQTIEQSECSTIISPVIARSDQNMALDFAAAKAVGAKVFLDGFALPPVINADRLSGYDYFDDVLYHGKIEAFLADKSIKKKYIVCTGALCQGLEEYMENRGISETSPIALSSAVKIALGLHPTIRADKNTLLLARQRIIDPINGKSGPKMLHLYAKQGAKVAITPCGRNIGNFKQIQMQDSGHAKPKQLVSLMEDVKEVLPDFTVLAVHGSPDQLEATKNLLEPLDIETYTPSNLDSFELSADGIKGIESNKQPLTWLAMKMVMPNPFKDEGIPLEGLKEIWRVNENYEPIEKVAEIENVRKSSSSGKSGKKIDPEKYENMPTNEKISPRTHKNRRHKGGKFNAMMKGRKSRGR